MNGLDRHPYLKIREDDTKRLRREFDDNKIYFGYNVVSGEAEAWYKPDSGPAYKISACENVAHACVLLRNRMKYDNYCAKQLLEEIDAHNDKIVKDKEDDAMHEVKSHLGHVARGRQIFMPPNVRSKAHAAIQHS